MKAASDLWPARLALNLKALLDTAFEQGASDIHIHCKKDGVQVRCRIDGALRTAMHLPTEPGRSLIQRIKAQCGMNIAESRHPQDGRLWLGNDGKKGVRVATHPSVYGENLVLRLLGDRSLALTDLGFASDLAEHMVSIASSAEGLFIVAGATGMGKTTTLHALMRASCKVDENTMTLEDPIEIEWPHATQTDLSNTLGGQFSVALRSLMRQDPDVILVGEIRDSDTARLALEAANTGHRVFASLHAPHVLGALSRLEDLGLHARQMLPRINGVLVQRLVPCTQGRRPDIELMDLRALPPEALRGMQHSMELAAWQTPPHHRGFCLSMPSEGHHAA